MKKLFTIALFFAFNAQAQQVLDTKKCINNDSGCLKKLSDEVNTFNLKIFKEKLSKCEPTAINSYNEGRHINTLSVVSKKEKACVVQIKTSGSSYFQECLFEEQDIKKMLEKEKNSFEVLEKRLPLICRQVADLNHPKGKETEEVLKAYKDTVVDFATEQAIKEIAKLKESCAKGVKEDCKELSQAKKRAQQKCKADPKSVHCRLKFEE